MASRDENEQSLYRLVADALKSWLTGVTNAVMLPFRRYRAMPDATAVYMTQGAWNGQVDTILTKLGQIAMDAWTEATDVPPVSRHAFVMAEIAKVRNLLVRIPDEVADLVFATIADEVNRGGTVDQVAEAVDQVLSFTGSERWTGRARTIAQTETTRAYGYGTVAAGVEMSRTTGRALRKQWIAHHDERTRDGHYGADGQRVPVTFPFYVSGEPLLYPGDPSGSPDNVIGCRCKVLIQNEEGR